ncbi:acyl-homoserine-lactone synthase [Sandarakinorhabdus sp. AAP62]|uniref:acyl-homoserine-lactone synthase n=1 Tax=Sandarakinorhabdus sp. AAP62 TaxID=1248916 RepID=UPI0002F22C92|nr:acyl-homoserine-lactone synthase [Sandarakinorhabdus sp. AAP62]
MFGTATTGTSHNIQAVSGLWRDVHGPAAAVASRGNARAALRSAMLKDRKIVLMDRLGWDLQSPDGLHEIDEYDGDDTLYLIVHQPQTGRHLGSVRLLPSTGAHLLGDKFAHLCADAVPAGPDVCEITRLVTSPGLSRSEALQVRRQLSIALFEHALAAGITRYTMVTHLPWLPSLLSIGWDAEPLGMPHGEGVNAVAALQIFVNEPTLQRLRGAWEIARPVLTLSPIGRENEQAF